MRRWRKSLPYKWTSLLLCLLILAPTYLQIGTASAQGKVSASENGKVSTSVTDQKSSLAKSKVNSDLKAQFNSKKYVTYLLKFKEQADTKKAAANAQKLAKKQKMTTAKADYTAKSAVVTALQTTASETQATVIKYLEKEKKAGQVKSFHPYYIVNGIAVTGTKDVMDKLSTFPEIEKILPNRTRQLMAGTQTDLRSQSTHSTSKTKETASKAKAAADEDIAWGVERIGAPGVWNMGFDGSGVVIGSIDTGVQWDHPALKEKYRGYDPSNPDQPNNEYNWFDAVANESTPYDDVGHGTHTIGTMVGSESDGSNQVGVAPGAQWISAKAFTADGGTDADLLSAGEWMLAPTDSEGTPHPEMAPDIINNSWGGGPGLDEWYRPMVQNWRAAGIFPEFSAGNTTLTNPGGPASVASPANYPEAFATGATDSNDNLASFSLQGPSPYDEIKPEVSAPGVNICSSVPGSQYDCSYSGTSMAGPHVSGTVALMLSADASLTVDEIEHILIDTATPETDSTFPESPNNGYGYGIIDAFSAVSSITEGLGTIKGQVVTEGQDTEPPTYDHTPTTEAFEGFELPLDISVQDNVSVKKVEILYQKENEDWQTVDAKQTDGDYHQGIYQGTIPAEAMTGSSIAYKWHIVDYGDNDVTSDAYTVTLNPPITTGYTQDFESTPTGWFSSGTNDSWAWGTPTSGPGQAASGENVYGTNLDGDYDNSTNATLIMPPIYLPEGQSYLDFNHWYDIESGYDHGQVFVSTDQENWEALANFTGSNGEWEATEVNLSDYAGQNIFIGFNLTTDGSVQKPGWYIDDVSLSDTPSSGTTKAQLGLVTKDQTSQLDKHVKTKKGQKVVDPRSIKPSKIKTIKLPKNEQSKVKPSAHTQSLPLDATVSVLETGRTAHTNPGDGSYSLLHAAGSYTLKAETYGYESQEQSVDVSRDGTSEANFTLQPIAQGTVAGTITNDATGDPISGATVRVMEDANIAPVQTDAAGHFSLKVYEGTYTLHASAPQFNTKDVEVTVEGDSTTQQDLALKPFIGYPGEIGYDDGTAENAHAFYDAGNGWAVKMSLPDGHEKAMVTGGLFRFWTDEFPVPGGTDFQVAVYDASGDNGAPGKKLAGPIDATALRDGTWTQVDLSDKGIVVDGDFYIVYIQTHDNTQSPGLATDEDGTNAGRSWQLVSGAWTPSPADEGNYMIRAQVSYEVTAPVITSPKDTSYTNQENVTVEGTSAPSTNVTLLNNGEEVATTQATDKGTFSTDITLQQGENTLTATASTDNGTTDPSEPVTVTLDQDKPELTIDSPDDGSKTNHETLTVQGTVSDEHLDWVKINGQKADIADDGTYSKRILLDNGENTIKVIAKDKAGNKKTQTVTVDVNYTAPEISDLQPADDLYLNAGESVKIEFNSQPGLDASYVIQMPLTNAKARTSENATELPMTETSDGHYVGYWTATSNLVADGSQIEVKVKDDYGNETRQTAGGKLYINVPNKAPTAQFDVPKKAVQKESIHFDGTKSSDPDGSIVQYSWNFGDGKKVEGENIEHAFAKKGKFKVTLTVTDNRGKTDTLTKEIKIKKK
ncbi:bacillopeptidase F [Pullulanibacillus pueri]|uniref:Bacillopeptidase F n=1 Tax=Pullulanibacillus pueri TaxID=1437324 RepID=A0A8J2ZYP8_9BACL|nr:S8 family serine peptidase [Pullulanibacillus pueri]MBM7683682.1 bacillopeptidase F [Pullulanibacillus pueri]GGH87129.1 bacillopeptidase F [Pullulanibacillus pueri]